MTTFYVIPFFSSADKRLIQNRKINLIIQYNPEFSCLHNNAPTFWIFLAVLSPNYQQFTLRQRWMFACKTTSFLRNSITDNLQKANIEITFSKACIKGEYSSFMFLAQKSPSQMYNQTGQYQSNWHSNSLSPMTLTLGCVTFKSISLQVDKVYKMAKKFKHSDTI